MVLIIDHVDNSVDDIRTGAVLIQPSAEFEDEQRILHEYIEAEANNDRVRRVYWTIDLGQRKNRLNYP